MQLVYTMSSDSSKKWLARQKKDRFVKQAQKEGVRSRAVYKIREIQNKYHCIKRGMRVLELGAAPGSWTVDVAQWVGNSGQVFAVDILPMQAIDNVQTAQLDITSEEFTKWLKKTVAIEGVDIVLSDMAPNMSGHRQTDQLRSIGLCEVVTDIATDCLMHDGSLLMKTFQGLGFQELVANLRKDFKIVKLVKPEASKRSASEVYVFAQGYLQNDKRLGDIDE